MDCCGKRECDCDLCEVPSFVNECFGGELSSGDDSRRIYVTLGQFSIVRLERDTQLLVPVYDYCMPDKECACGDGLRGPLRPVPQHLLPGGGVLPAQHCQAAGVLRRHQALLQVSGRKARAPRPNRTGAFLTSPAHSGP